MGVGMALLEETLYDARNGKPVNDNLAEYLTQEQEELSHGASRNARKKPKRRRKGEG